MPQPGGLINMPDARIPPDGTLTFGFTFSKPYGSLYADVVLLPRLELKGSYSRILHVPGFMPGPNINYGDFKDKNFDAKILLLSEGDYLPAVAAGVEDYIGTRLFSARYVIASKQLGPFDISLGYGQQRIAGFFGGVRYAPAWLGPFKLVAEYDAYNYPKDFQADVSGANKFKKGNTNLAIEYQWGWLGAQLSYQHKKPGVNAFVSIPLDQKEFVPKIDEPVPYTKITPRPSAEQWLNDGQHKKRLLEALAEQYFRNIRVNYVGNRLEATLTNSRISTVSRAVGRAARTMLLLSPVETREIRITYTVDDLPVTTYSFFDVERLQRYFNGLIPRSELAEYVSIQYSDPLPKPSTDDKEQALAAFDENIKLRVLYSHEGDLLTLRSEDSQFNKIRVSPQFSTYFNDPSGAFRYAIGANASYENHLADKTYFKLSSDLTLLQDISKVKNPSNSLLPHVRTDIAEYERTGKLRLSTAVVEKYYHPARQIFGRATLGLYEQMFGGAGGQLLYLPERKPYAVDLSIDWLRQRDFNGWFGFHPYETVQTLLSFHYRLPFNLVATARVGQFLARDKGTRFEMKRRFRSGVEIGGWYTLTDGKDITTPGTPSKPYHDKGVFMSIPLNSMLTKDTQAVGNMSLAPWTRDVGQMVRNPSDLYNGLEKPAIIDLRNQDGLSQLGDRDDDYPGSASGLTLLDRPLLATAYSDARNFGNTMLQPSTWKAIGLGLGVTAVSSALDTRAFNWSQRHAGNGTLVKLASIGDALPVLAMGASGLFALGGMDERLSDTAYASLQAGTMAIILAEGGKLAIGRSRPGVGVNNHTFRGMNWGNGGSSFPSGHTAVMWAAVTPYAKEYEAPWLYGLAAVTNFSRIVGRKHWVSDTVAGSLLGYAMGNLAWQWNRDTNNNSPKLGVDGQGVTLTWNTQ